MNYQGKTKSELIKELQRLQQELDSLKKSSSSDLAGYTSIENSLKESEERYRMLFENSGEAILLTNPDGSVCSANPEACRIFDMSEAEICEKGRNGIVDLNDKRLEPGLNERKKTGKIRGELNLLRKGGIKFPAEVTSTIFIDSSGNERTSMIICDLSELKKAEEAKRESQELFRMVIFNAPISIFATNKQGIFILHEGKALEKVGMKPGENVGVSAYDLFSELKVVGLNGEVTNGESVINRVLNGESLSGITELNGVYFDNQFAPMLDINNQVTGFIGVATDISTRIKAEAALRESEARYRSFFENSLIGISAASPDGRLLLVNPAYARMYGYENPEKMLAEVTDVGVLFANQADRKKVLQKLRMNGFMEAKEFKVVRRDGSRFFVLVSAYEIRNAEGKLLYNQAIHLDHSEQKKIEEELRNSMELLEKLNHHLQEIREIERATVSREIHDELGQSMTALKLDLNQMHKFVNANPEAVIKLESMIELVSNTIKDVQRIASNLRPGILDDLGLVSAIEWYCDEFEKRTGIKCKLELDDSDYSDSRKNLVFFRALQETLTNVIRHAKASSVSIKLQQLNKGTTMTIQDDGIGIPKEKIGSNKSLGLISMRERVKQFNGKIDISSKKGNGTKLVIFIPS